MQSMNNDFYDNSQFSPSSLNVSYDLDTNKNLSKKDFNDSSEIANDFRNSNKFFSHNEESVDAEIHFNSTNENTLKSKSSSLTRSDDIEIISNDSSKKSLLEGKKLIMKSIEKKQLQGSDKNLEKEYKNLSQQVHRNLVSDIFPKKPEIKKLLNKFKENSNIDIDVELLGTFYEQLYKLSSNNPDQDKRESLISNPLYITFMNQMEMLGLINNDNDTNIDKNELNLSEVNEVMKGLKNSNDNNNNNNDKISEKEMKYYLEYQSSIFIEFIKTNLDYLSPSYIYQTFITNLKELMGSEYYKEIDSLFKTPKKAKQNNPWKNKIHTQKSIKSNKNIINLFKEKVCLKLSNSVELK